MLNDEIDKIIKKYRNSRDKFWGVKAMRDEDTLNATEANKAILQLFDKSVERAKPEKLSENELNYTAPDMSVPYAIGHNHAIAAFESNLNKIKNGEDV